MLQFLCAFESMQRPYGSLRFAILAASVACMVVGVGAFVRILRGGPESRRRLWRIVTFREPGPPPPPLPK